MARPNAVPDRSWPCSSWYSIGDSVLRDSAGGVDGRAPAPPGGGGKRRVAPYIWAPPWLGCQSSLGDEPAPWLRRWIGWLCGPDCRRVRARFRENKSEGPHATAASTQSAELVRQPNLGHTTASKNQNTFARSDQPRQSPTCSSPISLIPCDELLWDKPGTSPR